MEDVFRIDERESRSNGKVTERVRNECERKGIEVSVEHLKTGDYVYGNGAIEFKWIGDALDSCLGDDPRIYSQAGRIAKEFEYGSIQIVGSIDELDRYLENRDLTKTQAEGILSNVIPEVMRDTGVPVHTFVNIRQFTKFGVRLLFSTGEIEKDSKLMTSPGVNKDPRVNQLSGITTIGYAKSKNILDEFGTMRKVANARFDELLEVDGIGWVTARKVWNTFNVPWDGSPNDVEDDQTNEVMEFLHLKNIGPQHKLEVYRETDELTRPPDGYSSIEEYIDEKFGDDIPDNHVKRMKEAL